MTARTKWVLAIVGLLGGNVIAMVILATVANVGHSEVIPDYYNQASHFDDVVAQGEVNRRLGWHVETSIVSGQLEVSVRDASGHPLDDAQVRVTTVPRAHASTRLELVPERRGGGMYRAIADQHPGIHDVAITVERGADRFVLRSVVVAR